MTELNIKSVTRFRKGEEVPEWLICQAPARLAALPAKVTFKTDVFVLDHPSGYVVINADLNKPSDLIHLSNDHNAIGASGKDVFLALEYLHLTPPQ